MCGHLRTAAVDEEWQLHIAVGRFRSEDLEGFRRTCKVIQQETLCFLLSIPCR